MLLKHAKETFFCISSSKEADTIRQAGFHFGNYPKGFQPPGKTVWWTNEAQVASKLLKHAHPDTQALIQKIMAKDYKQTGQNPPTLSEPTPPRSVPSKLTVTPIHTVFAHIPDEKLNAKDLKKKRIEEIGLALTPHQKKAIQEALVHVASICDGAHHLDNCGFGKVDVEFGKRLAHEGFRTPLMAGYAYKLALKYRRQIHQDLILIIKGEA